MSLYNLEYEIKKKAEKRLHELFNGSAKIQVSGFDLKEVCGNLPSVHSAHDIRLDEEAVESLCNSLHKITAEKGNLRVKTLLKQIEKKLARYLIVPAKRQIEKEIVNND